MATARVTSGRREEIWVSQDAISGPRNRFAAPFPTVQVMIPSHLGPGERLRTFGYRRDDQSSMPRSFSRGRRQWPQAISYTALATKIGPWRLGRRYMLFPACKNSLGQAHVRSQRHIRGTKPCHNGTCGTDGSTVFSTSGDSFPFKQQGPQPTIPPTEGRVRAGGGEV